MTTFEGRELSKSMAPLSRSKQLLRAKPRPLTRMTGSLADSEDIVQANLCGRQEVRQYSGPDACQKNFPLRPGMFAGTPSLFVTQPGSPPDIIQPFWTQARLTRIREFRYVSYILNEYGG